MINLPLSVFFAFFAALRETSSFSLPQLPDGAATSGRRHGSIRRANLAAPGPPFLSPPRAQRLCGKPASVPFPFSSRNGATAQRLREGPRDRLPNHVFFQPLQLPSLARHSRAH